MKTIKITGFIVAFSSNFCLQNIYSMEDSAKYYADKYSGKYYPCTISVKIPTKIGSAKKARKRAFKSEEGFTV